MLRYDMKSQYSLASTWPGKYADLSKCPVRQGESWRLPYSELWMSAVGAVHRAYQAELA